MITLAELLPIIKEKKEKTDCLFVGVSGHGNGGKTYITKKIAESLDDVSIIHIDDFYRPQGEEVGAHASKEIISTCFEWDRIENEVCKPIKENRDIKFQVYDWEVAENAGEVAVPKKGIIILEGIYAFQDRFLDYFNLTVWVEAPEEVRNQRAIGRYNKKFLDLWNTVWLDQDRRYEKAHNPKQKADIIVRGYSSKCLDSVK